MCEGTYKWPKKIPVGCPLEGTAPAGGVHYRVVYNNPADETSFLRTKDDPNQRLMRERFENGTLSKKQKCMAYATSHHKSYLGSINFIKLYKKRMSKMPLVCIAEVSLSPELGCMKQTGNKEHISVWFQLGASPWELVQRITEIDVEAA